VFFLPFLMGCEDRQRHDGWVLGEVEKMVKAAQRRRGDGGMLIWPR
jgi:hypothetical protein